MAKVGMLSFAHVHANGYGKQIVDNERTELVAIWDHMESRGKAAAVPAEQEGAVAGRCGAVWGAFLLRSG